MFLATAAAAIALAGCNKGPEIDAKDASVEEVQSQLAKTEIRPRAGRWEQELTILKMEMPNMPKEARAMLGEGGRKIASGYTCLTKEEAEKPDAKFFNQVAKGCKYDHFTMAGGMLDAKMTCTDGPQQQVSTMKGSYATDAYDLEIDMQAQMDGQPMHSTMALKMKRVGECTGKEELKVGG